MTTAKLPRRHLGALDVPAIGYGAMVLVHGMYGDNDDDRSIATLRHAVDAGATFIDTSDAYGEEGHNERLIGRAVADRREEVTLATKTGIVTRPDAPGTSFTTGWGTVLRLDGRPEGMADRAHASLERLGTEVIDLWYLHFPDPAVPIEETIGAMGEQVAAGTVRHLGVSNVTAEQLRRAHSAHPLAAVQYEWSLWSRHIEDEILPTARELGIGVVPWSPLGSGFLTGAVDHVGGNDFRTNHPRFSAENLAVNRDRFAPLREVAEELSITPTQLALAWLLAQGDDVVPIPGTRTPAHLDENLAAASVDLDAETLARIDEALPHGLAKGAALTG